MWAAGLPLAESCLALPEADRKPRLKLHLVHCFNLVVLPPLPLSILTCSSGVPRSKRFTWILSLYIFSKMWIYVFTILLTKLYECVGAWGVYYRINVRKTEVLFAWLLKHSCVKFWLSHWKSLSAHPVETLPKPNAWSHNGSAMLSLWLWCALYWEDKRLQMLVTGEWFHSLGSSRGIWFLSLESETGWPWKWNKK